MYFESMHFECAEGWNVEDPNTTETDDDDKYLHSGSMTLVQPQDIRQYIYILTPESPSLLPIIHAPGTIIPLGRLDISWRSLFGEPGRLLTSMLSRRIPLATVPPQQPVSALPPYLKRTVPGSPSRPQSPQLVQSRPSSPSPMMSARSQSPFQALPPPIPDIEVSLVIRDALQRTVRVEEPFTIPFRIVLSAAVPADHSYQRRVVTLVLQHLQPPRTKIPSLPPLTHPPEAVSPRAPSSGFSTPSSAVPSFNYALAHQKLLMVTTPDAFSQDRVKVAGESLILPPPYFDEQDESKIKSTNVVFIGSSVLVLPPIEFTMPVTPGDQATAVHEFDLSYLPLRKGFTTVGGLRVLLVEDRFIGEGQTLENLVRGERNTRPRTLKDWDIISEVWVAHC